MEGQLTDNLQVTTAYRIFSNLSKYNHCYEVPKLRGFWVLEIKNCLTRLQQLRTLKPLASTQNSAAFADR